VPREWIPNPGAKRDWYWIVIHHSATPSGSEKDFDREHKEKGWDECGYHFVIGNGTNSGNGQIEIGPRWPKQKYGAHAKTPDNRFNEHGIGICLVGNFDVDRPTTAQMASLTKLVKYLMVTYNIPATRVLGHRDTKPTDCPGRNFNVAIVRRAVQQQLAESGDTSLIETADMDTIDTDYTDVPTDPVTASAELLQDVSEPVSR
jgi:N-acetyl-anhydromuramyl-L-alanine amidase AmpD